MSENSDTEPPLSREGAKGLLQRDYENLCRKVDQGHPIGVGERVLLANVAESGSPTATSFPAFVARQTELARALGVTRRTVHAWREEGAPESAANGLWNVPAWKAWMRSHGKKGGTGDTDDPEKAQLEARKLVLQNEKLSHEIGILKSEYIHVDVICADVARSSIEARKILLAMPPALSAQLVGLSKIEIHDRLRVAVDEALEKLYRLRLPPDVDDVKTGE